MFQSTRPVRGATTDGKRIHGFELFQSTRPVRGATDVGVRACCRNGVSIHAPRAGRDFHYFNASGSSWSFNPRAPCGARPTAFLPSSPAPEFQSTRPVRGATYSAIVADSCHIVSIHAPRAGRDYIDTYQIGTTDVSIHAPRAGRDLVALVLRLCKTVSIHAPRAGRDAPQHAQITKKDGFNPRAPCGARLQKRSRLPSFATYSWVLLAMNTVCLAHTSHTPPLMWFTHLYFFTSFSVYFTFALLKVLRKALINSAPPS